MNKPDDFDCWRLPDDDSVKKCARRRRHLPQRLRRPENKICARCYRRLAACARTHRVSITNDTKVANAATLVIEREDHTLGNILRM